MTTADFVRRYEAALATQEWEEVSPLLHPNASVTFSDGSVHKGKAAVQAAFERNFQAIVEENYRITNVHWLLDSDDTAVYMFDFHWSGKINRHDASGAGKGTSVLTIKAEVDARYLREWLSSNAALGYVEYNADTDQFSLTPEQAALFAHEGEVTCMQGFFQAMSRSMRPMILPLTCSDLDADDPGANTIPAVFAQRIDSFVQDTSRIWSTTGFQLYKASRKS